MAARKKMPCTCGNWVKKIICHPDCISHKANKPRKDRKSLSAREIDLDKVNKNLLNVLSRDTLHLMEKSHLGKLDAKDAASLAAYLKLLQDLRKDEEKALKDMPDEQLEKLAKT